MMDPHPLEDMRRLALSLRHSPDDELTRIIAETCRAGGGHWQDPAPHSTLDGSTSRPATHLFEISLHGQTATGTTPQEAAHNWRHCALTQIDSPA